MNLALDYLDLNTLNTTCEISTLGRNSALSTAGARRSTIDDGQNARLKVATPNLYYRD